MTQLSEGTYTGEWLKWLMNRDFCLDVLTTKAATADIFYPGSLLRDDTGVIIVANGQEANVDSIYMGRQLTVAGGELVLCLVRGPAIIDPDLLNYETDVTWADLAAALAALDIRPAQAALATWETQAF